MARHVDPIVAALRERRQALGLSQAEVARRIHSSPASWCEVENGLHSPSIWRLRRYAEVLDCDVVLVPRSDPPPPVTDEMAGLPPDRRDRDAVLRLTRHGMSARAIAQRLGVSKRTIVRIRSEARGAA